MNCPCGSGQNYEQCCEALIKGERLPETAEQLMRSRYSAFVKQEIPYLYQTIHPDCRQDWDEQDVTAWSKNAAWHGLDILFTEAGTPADDRGIVEFVARFSMNGEELRHHERSVFEKVENQWYFKEGKLMKPKPIIREEPKVGRNEPCPCGSGKKYKKCCGT